MAMFESEGFCPSNSFVHFRDRNPLANEIMKVLDDQTGYMVYVKDGCCWSGESSIVDALIGGEDGIFGLKVANYLNFLDPECTYAEHGKKILIEDFLNPERMVPGICWRYDSGEGYKFSFPGNGATWDEPKMIKDGVRLFYDDRYLLAIKDGEDIISIKIFKLPKND